MSAEATALILGLTDAEQAEYAAAPSHHKTPAPEPEGEASTGAGQTPAADVEGASASGAPRERIHVGGLVGDTGIWCFGEGCTVYIDGQCGVKRGLDRITPERLRGVFVRLDHPETGRMDSGDMLYVEVGAVPVGENGQYREIISTRVVDRDQFDRMTGITDLRRDLGWRD